MFNVKFDLKFLQHVALIALSVFLITISFQIHAREGNLGMRLGAYLAENEKRGFSGAVLVAENGKVTLRQGYGYADKEKKISNTTNTVFDMGSITKVFTANAILKLVEMGKVDLEDPLSKFFDVISENKKAITLHQLLTHTSGISEYTGDDYEKEDLDVFLKETFERDLNAKPGESFEYANIGYSLLGLIIERVSGQDYESFIAEHILRPAGMKHTGYEKPDWSKLPIAQGYDFGKDEKWGSSIERWAEDGGVSWNLIGNGGLLTTPEDMYKWVQALDEGKLLSPELKKLHEAPIVIRPPEERRTHYGYGWQTRIIGNDTKLLFHPGGNTIFFAVVLRFVDDGKIIILMVNEGYGEVYKMTGEIFKMGADSNYKPELMEKVSWLKRARKRLIGK